jgi:phosphoserine phosphatase RsbU/P
MPNVHFPNYLQDLFRRMEDKQRPAFIEGARILGPIFHQFFIQYGFVDQNAERLAEQAVYQVSTVRTASMESEGAEAWLIQEIHKIARAELERLQTGAAHIEKARTFQERLFRIPSVQGLEISAAYRAARTVTGDFHDAFLMPDGSVMIVFGDVSGKGPDAALYAALVIGTIRGLAQSLSTIPSLQEALELVLLEANLAPAYCSLVLCQFFVQARRLLVTGCGAPAPLILSKSCVTPLVLSGAPVALLERADSKLYEFQMQVGDTLVLYTDGVTDQFDCAGESFGEERLSELLKANSNAPSPELPRLVLSAVAKHRGAADVFDDQMVLVLSQQALPAA